MRTSIKTIITSLIIWATAAAPLLAQDSLSVNENVSIFDLSLEDLLSTKVVSASNTGEILKKAPATMIVITRQNIEDRGYLELFDVFNDLPGFDLARAFGEDEYYVYARGYRRNTSDQMLLMVDGIIMNHLYNNGMMGYAQYPLQNVERIEIVYGPASAIYGPNAFAGLINIITNKNDGLRLRTSLGSNNMNLIDAQFISTSESGLKLGINTKIYHTQGFDFTDRHPLLRKELYTDQSIWGPFAKTEYLQSGSETNGRYAHAFMQFKGLEVGVMHWLYESGYGTVYPADKVLPFAKWGINEKTYYARYEKNLSDRLSSRTLIRGRESGNPPNSLFIERYSGGVDASYWQTKNYSVSLYQDFTYNLNDKWLANFGFKYDQRSLQRSYLVNYGPFLPEDSVLTKSYPFPALPNASGFDQHNHSSLIDRGAYAQLKYLISDKVDLITGLRYDYNSVWKGVLNPRIGIVAQPNSKMVAKIFFGTAFLEPTARILYGGWSGTLSNENLRPERMNTLEASYSYTLKNVSIGANFYYNLGLDAIGLDANKVPINLGKRRMMGAEIYTKFVSNEAMGPISRIHADLFVSWLKSEEALSEEVIFTNTGNMAPIKVKAIITAQFGKKLSISAQNRYISNIITPISNPAGEVKGYFVSDLTLSLKNVAMKGCTLQLKGYNLLDVMYDHPGYRNGDGGMGTESDGWYMSVHPQPGRQIYLSAIFDF